MQAISGTVHMWLIKVAMLQAISLQFCLSLPPTFQLHKLQTESAGSNTPTASSPDVVQSSFQCFLNIDPDDNSHVLFDMQLKYFLHSQRVKTMDARNQTIKFKELLYKELVRNFFINIKSSNIYLFVNDLILVIAY